MIHADDMQEISRAKSQDKSSYESAVGLVTLPNLRFLNMDGVRLAESLYRGIVIGARFSQVIILYLAKSVMIMLDFTYR